MDDYLNRRRILKGRITRIENIVASHSNTPLTPVATTLYKGKADALTEELDNVHDQIIQRCPPEDIDSHEAEYNQLATRMDTIIIFLNTALISQAPSISSSVQPPTQPSSDIRLPRLELPNFGGNYTDWIPFHDLFTATVHNNGSLSGAQKLQYLKTTLRDEAALLIQSFPVTDGNYAEAWDILVNRYHNPREIVKGHIKRLFNQPSVKDDSSTTLRRLIDTTAECIRSLKVLQEPVHHWDAILLYLISEKLDVESRRQWELSLTGITRPNFEELTTFLEQRARALAASQSLTPARTKLFAFGKKSTATHHGVVGDSACPICKESHPVFKCPELLQSSIEERWNKVKKLSLCFNCLKSDHVLNSCKSGSCRKCKFKHNTLLHQDSTCKGSSQDQSGSSVVSHVSRRVLKTSQIILPTAIIQVQGSNGQNWSLRALLDSGSQASFISEHISQKLQLRRTYQRTTIGGIGASGISQSHGGAMVTILSKLDPAFNVTTQVLILRQVTNNLPNFAVHPHEWNHLTGLKLADPTFHSPGPIDILLGADVFVELVLDGKVLGKEGSPGAFNTVFGWAITGTLGKQPVITSQPNIQVNHCQIQEQLSKFWELEEIQPEAVMSSLEKQSEKLFHDTHRRDHAGRYIVTLPINAKAGKLGNSRNMALRRLQYMERRLETKPEQYESYRKFMNEYIQLNHMELIPVNKRQEENCYYLPHHAVFKASSTTTKIRVVFDGSAKTTSGKSLNDILMVGPKLQDDLVNLLTRFRSHSIALTADIEKMYRQILVDPNDANQYQRILWRSQKNEPVQDYYLRTVTYGTAAAPYLATRVLKQLSIDIKTRYPMASQALAEDFYMDDLVSGCDDAKSALILQTQLIQATTEAGLPLRKWSSNDSTLTKDLPPALREAPVSLHHEGTTAIQTLGLHWMPSTDSLFYTVKSPRNRGTISKRTILSDTARIFDPLGLLSPIIIRAKILLQDIWQIKLDWDDEVSLTIRNKWDAFREELCQIEELQINRYISQRHPVKLVLHAFCDASEKAYAAAVYLKSISNTGTISVQLIAAKTKVAPLKQTTLPRLELCAAVLLSRLITLVQKSFRSIISEVHGWSDSKIVLAWLAAAPQRWKTFVANRVAEVQGMEPPIQWHHIAGEQNPADCASRGIHIEQLISHPLWWQGPDWLREDCNPDQEPMAAEPEECTIEERTITTVVAHCNLDHSLLMKYSSLSTLLHVTAYVLRFIRNLKIPRSSRDVGPLTKDEVHLALNHWIEVTQLQNFGEEIHQLQRGHALSSSSKLLSLTPYLDKEGILRVGGRLRHAKLPLDQKHPVLLPRRSRLTDLLITHEHLNTLHGGPQLMMSSLQARFWILGLRDVVRFHVKRCMRCVRHQARTVNQLMGDLPANRVNPARAFIRCGVDYAGPFNLKVLKGRGCKTYKGYIAVFACFTTRALHLELVSDLSTSAFLAALRRFVSRRGKSTDIYSDCGTNFVGANRELKEFLQMIDHNTNNQAVTRWAASEGINWHFNPPAAPHFGGLWEAGVKSVKHHLKRVVGETKLNYEEMQTLLCQIEACLKSRPLSPLSSDPSDLSALTPGHFLIGSALIAIPEPDLTSTKINRLSRWQLGQQLLQQFWKRWQSEYLSRLQQRPKWTKPSRNLQLGDLVLLKEDLPPTKWKLARITKVHPGADELVRVVTVKTADKELKRPIVKLCPLPLDLN